MILDTILLIQIDTVSCFENNRLSKQKVDKVLFEKMENTKILGNNADKY